MSNKEKNIISLINVFLGLIMTFGVTFIFKNINPYIKLGMLLIITIFTVGTFVLMYLKKFKLTKTCFLINVMRGKENE